jgi:hypothetical protein
MSKKTMPVAKLLHMANTYLASKNTTKEGRRAIDGMIATILHETGNYYGFSINESPEIAPSSDDAPVRHRYYVSGKLSDDYDAIAAASTY